MILVLLDLYKLLYNLRRYAATNQLTNTAKVRYVVAEPSSYVYFDDKRWVDGKTYRKLNLTELASCPKYDEWRFGFAGGVLKNYNKYFNHVTLDNSREKYKKSKISYLFGLSDVCPWNQEKTGPTANCGEKAVGDVSSHCGDIWQGRSRTSRGINFWRSLVEIFEDELQNTQMLQTIPFVDHDGLGIVCSEYSRPIVFGKKTAAVPAPEVAGSDNGNFIMMIRFTALILSISTIALFRYAPSWLLDIIFCGKKNKNETELKSSFEDDEDYRKLKESLTKINKEYARMRTERDRLKENLIKKS